MGRKFLFLLLCWSLLVPVGHVAAGEPPPAEDTLVHTLRPGETLFSLAERYGVSVSALMEMNQLADPRDIFVGQSLYITPAASDVTSWEVYDLGLGESVGSLARQRCRDVRTVAHVNGLLNPNAVFVGHALLLPPERSGLGMTVAGDRETPLGVALLHERPFWEVVKFNSAPLYAGANLLIPGMSEEGQTGLPSPIRSLHLTPQPVVRGRTSVLTIEAAASIRCSVTYLDRTAPCFPDGDEHAYALISFSPMLEPGTYDISLQVASEDQEMAFTLPVVVTEGRFGFERIDLPPSRQSLFDPELLRSESALVNEMANTHTQQRFWTVPFDYPVQASVSSYFGARRSYGGSYNSYHSGVDFRAATGAPVQTPMGGMVVMAEQLTVRGNAIIIDHGWGVLTGYWHLSQIDVKAGQRVSKGEVIGRVGNTGLSTGAHLHWQVWVDGEPVDPLQWAEAFYPFPEPQTPTVIYAE
jgi:murein DD-endopeptidase MepM/ murein hydrolase activator NlpD